MHTNHLAAEKSPYLLQHAHNPVNWYPWGEEAFAAARQQNKPIFLSIGYSTCYWCHVMEKDSFENEAVAAALNKSFISIKVDREERPDIDSIYMNAVVSLTGRGGWPMSVFLTTDLKPFYGGTFFPREQFVPLLEKIGESWTTQRATIDRTGEQIAAALRADLPARSENGAEESWLRLAFEQLGSTFDGADGGFGAAPKFPPSQSVRLLLRIHRRAGSEDALKMAAVTLEKMARGGLFDHLGGGFHRYSTDRHWLVPHFEKMLYDNALLTVAYIEGYQATGNEMFRAVAEETLDYVLRDMTAPQGGFYSAEDAGEVGKEGEFYVWKETELRSLLAPAEYTEIKKLYGVTTIGNFEHKTNILNLQEPHEWSEKRDALAAAAMNKLRAARAKRGRPHRDDKILTSWNGLMITAFARGAEAFGKKEYLEAAERAAGFLKSSVRQNGKLLRRFRDGDARFDAFLDDHAFLIQGLIALYEADGDRQWIDWARELQAQLDTRYWDENAGGYFFTSGEDASVIARQKDFTDGAEPSGNGVTALNLLKLFDLTLDKSYKERAEKLFAATPASLPKYPSAFTSVLAALDYRLDRSKEVAVVGAENSKEAQQFRELVRKRFLPNKVLAWGKPADLDDDKALGIFRGKKLIDGKTTFYVCEEGACKLPTTDAEKAIGLMAEIKPLGPVPSAARDLSSG